MTGPTLELQYAAGWSFGARATAEDGTAQDLVVTAADDGFAVGAPSPGTYDVWVYGSVPSATNQNAAFILRWNVTAD